MTAFRLAKGLVGQAAILPIYVASFLLLGCGEIARPAESDGGPVVDAPGDGPSPRVAVTVLSSSGDGLPDPGAIVIFTDNARTLVKEGLVTAAGKAEADLPDGGTVQVLRVNRISPTARRVEITTLDKVKPGDELTFGKSRFGPLAGDARTLGVAFPLVTGATTYVMWTPCGGKGGTASPIAVTLLGSCAPASFELLAVATGDATFTPSFVRRTINPGEASVTLPTAWAPMAAFGVTMTNAPAGIRSILVQRGTLLATGTGQVATQSVNLDAPAPGGTATASLPYPPGVGRRAQILVQLAPSSIGVGVQSLWVRSENIVAAVGIDLAQLPLPLVTVPPRITGAQITWTQTGSGTPDVRLATAFFSEIVDGQTTSFDWTIVNDSAANSATLPGLPAKFAEFDPLQRPAARATIAAVQYYDYSHLAGYDSARRHAIGDLTTPASGLTPDAAYTARSSVSQAQQ
jgi:hypothetical protein